MLFELLRVTDLTEIDKEKMKIIIGDVHSRMTNYLDIYQALNEYHKGQISAKNLRSFQRQLFCVVENLKDYCKEDYELLQKIENQKLAASQQVIKCPNCGKMTPGKIGGEMVGVECPHCGNKVGMTGALYDSMLKKFE